MTESQLTTKFKLAAIDLDGTLLAPDGTIHPANQNAVNRLQQAGLQVVLASGRHYKSMRRYAEALPGIQWLVSSQGGELSDLQRTIVLGSDFFLTSASVAEMVTAGHAQGFSPVAFGVDGVFTTANAAHNPDLDFFTELDGHAPVHCELQPLLKHDIFKVIWVGNPVAVERNLLNCPVDLTDIQLVRTDFRFLEFMPAAMSKATALQTLATRLGIQAAETIAFGDGDNDIPMFRWAGVSVAMPHGWPMAIRVASHQAPFGPAATALARGVDLLFEQGILKPLAKNAATGGMFGQPHSGHSGGVAKYFD